MKNKKISIILPVYNVEDYLERCLNSILNQTYQNFEIICVDDGSSDKSLNILNEYKEKHSNIKVFTQANKGVSAARNVGLKNTSGEYITFFDSDDVMHNMLLEILIKNADETTISKCSFISFDDNNNIEFNNKIDKNFKIINHKSIDYFLTTEDLNITVWGKMFHKDIIKDYLFDEKCFFSEEVLFGCLIYKNNLTLAELDIPLIYYYKNANSIVHKKTSIKKLVSLLNVAQYVHNKYNGHNTLYKMRVKKSISNVLKYIDDCDDIDGIKKTICPKIKELYKSKIISYNDLSFSKKIKLFKILFCK